MEEKTSHYCKPCNQTFNDKHNYDRHLSRTSHLKNEIISIEHMQCNICNYSAKRIAHFKSHLETKKHMKAELEYINNQTKYNCNKCSFYANSKTEYTAHINTQKHKDYIDTVECIPCDRDRVIIPQENTNTNTKLFMQLLKENTQFQQSLMEYCMKQNVEMQTQMLEFCKNTIQNNIAVSNNTNNNNTNTNNSNNNTFNINIFLNETCKDAININDFIESLTIDSDAIENIGREGYVEGMTKIFFGGLGQLEMNHRPIHCTDVKRETFYIRDDNKWNKDKDNKRIMNAISRVIRKNQGNLHLWREKNPRYDQFNTAEYEFHLELMKQCIGGGMDREDINNRRLIRNLAKFTSIAENLRRPNLAIVEDTE